MASSNRVLQNHRFRRSFYSTPIDIFADHWTAGLDVAEYLSLCQELYDAIKSKGDAFWRTEDDIVIVPTPDVATAQQQPTPAPVTVLDDFEDEDESLPPIRMPELIPKQPTIPVVHSIPSGAEPERVVHALEESSADNEAPVDSRPTGSPSGAQHVSRPPTQFKPCVHLSTHYCTTPLSKRGLVA